MKNFRLAKHTLSVWVLLVSTTLLFSQQKSIPIGYYDGTETLSGATLKTALYHIIKGHTDLGYDGLYNAYKTTDNLVIGGTSYVFDMYSVNTDSTADYYYKHVTGDHCGNYSGEGDCYNREHSFPQSWFGSGTPKSDAFQVYPTDGYVNGRRGNFPYGEVTTPTWTSTNGSKVGSCTYPGYAGTVFEPIDEYKGDFARTYFYIATRYENVIAGWPGSPMTNGTSFPCYTTWALNLLIDWNNQDPISTKEINRNEAIFLLQHNRNPFIDHPEFVAKIWGGDSPSVISNITIQPEVPTQTDAVNVMASITDAEGINTAILKWGLLSNSITNSITMITEGSNLFETQSAIPAQNGAVTVYFKIEATDINFVLTSSPVQSYIVTNSDLVAPVLIVTPSDGTLHVPIASNIIINSNEPLKNSNGNPLDALYVNSVISVSNYQGSISCTVSIASDQKQITLTPENILNYQSVYTVNISNKAFADAAGNKTQALQTTFTTVAAPDTQAPLLSISPPVNSIDVDINASIKINSNEPLFIESGQPINPGYLESKITLNLTDSTGASVDYSAGISNSNQMITISPSVPLTYETSYFVKVASDAFTDSSGNSTDSIISYFTTKPLIDNKPPAFTAGFPKSVDITPNSFGLIVSIDEPGKVYYQVKLKAETAPTVQQLLESSFIDIWEGYEPDTISFSALTAHTAYSVYLLTQDRQLIPNTSAFALKQNITTLGIAPAVITNPNSQTICKGDEVLFVTSASGTEPLSFQWYYNETSIENATDDTLVFTSVTENDKGFYSCHITNDWGFVITQQAELAFIADVFAGTDNQKTVKDTLSILDLAGLLLDSPTPSGTWTDLGNTGALNGSVFYPSNAGIGTFRFSYKVTNPCMADSSIIKVTVEGISPKIISQPADFLTCEGGEAIFAVKVEGTAPFTYEWNFNDSPIASSDNDTLFLKNVNHGFLGNFTCTVTSEWGIDLSETAVLNFYTTISAGTDNQVTIKNTVFEVDLSDFLINQPTPGGEWKDIDQTGALVGSLFNPNQAGAGVYHFDYRVTNPCMTDTATITVTVEWPDVVDELELRSLLLYPNPTTGIITVEIPSKMVDFSAQLFNPDGKLLKQTETAKLSGNPILDFSEFGKGIYFVKMRINSSVLIRKVVIE